MAWKKIKLGDLVEQYRVQHIVQDNRDYGQITISKNGYIKFRTTKNGKSIGRKRQFIIDLQKYPNTLLFTRQGVSEGAIAFASIEVDGCIATENMPMFSLKNNINRKFVELLLKSEQYINEVKKLIPTGSAQKSIHERDLMQILLTVPNEEEQKKLSKRIDNHLNNIEVLNTEISYQQELVKKLRQSILQESIEGKLTTLWREQNKDIESASVLLEKIKHEKKQLIKDKKIKKQKPLPPINEDEIPFNIPNSWEWINAGEVVKLTDNLNIQTKLNTNAIINYVDIDAINNTTYTIDNIKIKPVKKLSSRARRILKKDFIVYSTVRPYLNNITIIKNNITNFIGSTGFIVFQPINILNKYFFFFLLSPYIKKYYLTLISGFNSPSITNDNFFTTYFPLPPLKEQKEIVKKIESLFKVCDDLEEQINSSKTNSQTLMKAVLKEAFEKQ